MGLFTQVKQRLNPVLFDEDNRLRGSVRSLLLKRVYDIIPQKEIAGLFILGSNVSYTWNDESDIDINVILNDESKGQEYWHPIVKQTNGFYLQGTKHPINLFVQEIQRNNELPNFETAPDGVYDLLNDNWVKLPTDPKDLPNIRIIGHTDLQYADLIVDDIKNTINHFIQKYMIWKNSGYTKGKEDLIRELNDLISIFNELDWDRKLAYRVGIGKPRYSPANIIFKYIDHVGLLHILEDLKEKLLPTFEQYDELPFEREVNI